MIYRPISFIVIVLALITAGILYVAHGFHEAEQARPAQKARAYRVTIERECALAFPLRGESYESVSRNCFPWNVTAANGEQCRDFFDGGAAWKADTHEG